MRNSNLLTVINLLTEDIVETIQSLSVNESGYHADVDRSDDENTRLKKRITALRRIREELENLE